MDKAASSIHSTTSKTYVDPDEKTLLHKRSRPVYTSSDSRTSLDKDSLSACAVAQDDDVFEPDKKFYVKRCVEKKAAEKFAPPGIKVPSASFVSNIHSHVDPNGNPSDINEESLSRIFICSRTHTQLSQLVQVLKSTKYTPSMAVLGSREQMCIHPSVVISKTKIEDCSKLIGGGNTRGCSFYQASNFMANHPSMRAVWDIEDIVTKGHQFRACPYFTAKDIAQRAEVVFCPYNFLIDKLTRESSGIKLKNNIVIFDEAHNLEDQCREVASFTLTASLINAIVATMEVCQSFPNCPPEAEDLKVAFSQIPHWIQVCEKRLSYEGSGDKILEFMAELVPSQFEQMGFSWTIVKALTIKASQLKDWHEKVIELCEAPGAFRWECPTDGTIHSFVPSFTGSMRAVDMILLVMAWAHEFKVDYAICLLQTPKDAEVKVNIWCLNPGVAFKDLHEQCRSVVLISGALYMFAFKAAPARVQLVKSVTGTLSPMDSFSSELGCEFPIRLEAPHVIDCELQVNCNYVSDFNLSFNRANSTTLHQRLGQLIIDVCNVTPNGILVFCTSYWWIETLCQSWRKNGQWETLNSIKSVFTEPNFNDKNFPILLKKFEAAACTSKGAVMFAVCRGKISEGLDLKDRCAFGIETACNFPVFNM
jgi:Fanconi anemia group J protein